MNDSKPSASSGLDPPVRSDPKGLWSFVSFDFRVVRVSRVSGGKGGRGSWEWTCSFLYGQFKLSMLTGAWSQLDGLKTSGNGQRSKTEQKQEQLGARRRIKDKES